MRISSQKQLTTITIHVTRGLMSTCMKKSTTSVALAKAIKSPKINVPAPLDREKRNPHRQKREQNEEQCRQ